MNYLKFIMPLAFCFSAATAADSLFVFYPTEITAKSVQNSISETCPKMDVTVFGRSKDFRKEVSKNPPNAILSLAPVVESLPDFSPIIGGKNKGKSESKYVLVSVETPIDVSQLEQTKIGVIDILGRKPMSAYISNLFGKKVKLKRVTKVEDLLPLLTFGSVSGIFISEGLYETMKSKSNLELIATPLDIQVGLTRAATSKSESNETVTQCVSQFDAGLNSTFGIDEWATL